MMTPSNSQRSQQEPLVLHTRVVTGTGGGPDKTILNSPRFLRDEGYPMLCAFLRPPGDRGFAELERRAEQWQAPIVAIDDEGPLDWHVLSRLRELCDTHAPAIWHGHDYKSNLLGLLLRRHFPMKLVTTVHGWVKNTWKTPLYYAIDRWCLRRYDHVICVSEDLHRDCLKLGVASDRCTHLPNGIDTVDFARNQATSELRQRLGLGQNDFLLGALGRLSHEKGFDLLLTAFQRLLQSESDSKASSMHLVLGGHGDEREALENQARELGIASRVHFLGFCSDSRGFYRDLDLFVLSSRREGLPNVVLEAMAMEVPVIATRINGVPRLVDHDVNGWLIDSESVEALVDSMELLRRDGSLRQRLADAGRQTIETRFSFRLRMDRMRTIYDTVLALPNPALSQHQGHAAKEGIRS